MANDHMSDSDQTVEQSDAFYDQVPILEKFDQLTDQDNFVPVPANWWIAVADIVGSTKLIEGGHYKKVNTIGAAVISAQVNALVGVSHLYTFGGDGAASVFPEKHLHAIKSALRDVKRWALDEFDVELRVAVFSIAEAEKAGKRVLAARNRVTDLVSYTMFEGGGVSWAENAMKDGLCNLEIAEAGRFPDLTGLSCRWTPMESQNGTVVSLIIQPQPGAPAEDVASVMHEVVSISSQMARQGHPSPEEGPGFTWPPEGLDLEARASKAGGSLALRRLMLLLETFIAWIFFKTGWKAGTFVPAHYVKTTGQNADFRKIMDGLMMTIDCDEAGLQKIEALLENATNKGLLRYGTHKQSSAIMTCIVPSVTRDDHLHFIDGAAGGYAIAARAFK